MSEIQREALSVMSEVMGLSPEVRLGQLMAHIGFLGEVHIGKGLGDIEDDELIAVLYRHRAELKARLEGTTNPALPPTGSATSVSGELNAPGGGPALSDRGIVMLDRITFDSQIPVARACLRRMRIPVSVIVG